MNIRQAFSRWSRPPTRSFDPNSGQAIVLIGISALALLAMMGLAIDGGRLLFLKRETQNAADAAAIAAARAMCAGREDFVQAGLSAADANGFDDNESDNWVDINAPPLNADITIEEDCEGCYVEAVVRGEIPASFVGLVYNGPLTATSRTVGACNPNEFVVLNYEENGLRAGFSISDTCETGLTISEATVLGGLHANGLLKVSPSQGGAVVVGPSSYKSELFQEDKAKVDWRASLEDDAKPDETPAGTCERTCFEPGSDTGGDDEAAGGSCTPGSFPLDNPFRVCEDIPDPMAASGVNIARYAPGGDIASTAAAKGEYFAYTGTCKQKNDVRNWIDSHITGQVTEIVDDTPVTYDVLATGLYYFPCTDKAGVDVNQFDTYKGTITWVTTTTMHISGGMNNLTAYVGSDTEDSGDDLLFFANGGSNECSDKVLKFSGNNNISTGNMYAPHGEIDYSGSYSEAYGCLTGYQVTISGSETMLVCEPGIPEVIGDPGIWVTE